MINSPLKQPSTADETHFKRLRYRSWHRGCKETDLILGSFADNQLISLDPALIPIYERLLDENDADIWNWLTGQPLTVAEYKPLLDMMTSSIAIA
jgi:antitoxin CptB